MRSDPYSPPACPATALLLGYKYFGLNRGTLEGKVGTWYREWAPGAKVCGAAAAHACHLQRIYAFPS